MAVDLVLVDGRKMLREGLRLLLAECPDFRVIGEAADPIAAVPLVRALSPQVVIFIVSKTTPATLTIVNAFVALSHPPRVIVYAAHPEPWAATALLADGAAGYLSGECDSKELIAAVRVACAGRAYISSELVGDLLSPGSSAAQGPERELTETLSARERDTLCRIADGCTTRDIAEALGVSVKSVETYRRRAMQKLGCTSVAQLIKLAMRQGMTSV